MRISVRLFAILRSREGADQISLELPDGATLATLLDTFFNSRAELLPLRAHLRVGQNGALVERATEFATVALRDLPHQRQG